MCETAPALLGPKLKRLSYLDKYRFWIRALIGRRDLRLFNMTGNADSRSSYSAAHTHTQEMFAVYKLGLYVHLALYDFLQILIRFRNDIKITHMQFLLFADKRLRISLTEEVNTHKHTRWIINMIPNNPFNFFFKFYIFI